VFGRLEPTGATQAMLLTNRPPSSGLAAQGVKSFSDEACTEWTYGDDSSVPADAGRGRRIFRHDSRSIGDLTASVAALVRAFRRDRHFSLGESTARLVSINLLYRIFGAAAGGEPGGFSEAVGAVATLPVQSLRASSRRVRSTQTSRCRAAL
jgi:hypothetical protein